MGLVLELAEAPHHPGAEVYGSGHYYPAGGCWRLAVADPRTRKSDLKQLLGDIVYDVRVYEACHARTVYVYTKELSAACTYRLK